MGFLQLCASPASALSSSCVCACVHVSSPTRAGGPPSDTEGRGDSALQSWGRACGRALGTQWGGAGFSQALRRVARTHTHLACSRQAHTPKLCQAGSAPHSAPSRKPSCSRWAQALGRPCLLSQPAADVAERRAGSWLQVGEPSLCPTPQRGGLSAAGDLQSSREFSPPSPKTGKDPLRKS